MRESLIGASLPLVNGRDKVLGIAQYVSDMKMAGLLHAKLLRSPYPHARIVHIDLSRARALKGVKAVLTGEDTPPRLWGPLKKEQRILATGRVRYAGEEVAAVVATDEGIALDAVELIRVEYEPLPAVLTPESALLPGAPEVHEGSANLAYEIKIERGNVEAGFKRAKAIYEQTYEMSYQYPAYMEPMGSIAAVDGNGRVTVWAPSQSVFLARGRIADALNVTPSQVRVIQTVVGGGFGGKTAEDANMPIAAFLALKTGRPVRLVNNRLEDFLSARPSLPERIWLKMGVAADGEIVAKETLIIADNGAYTGTTSEMVHVSAMRSDSMHRLQNVRAHGRLIYTNKLPSGAFRGFGGQQMAFALNSHLTMLSQMISMDPVEIQLKNAIRTGETSVHGWHMGSCGLSECLESARDAVSWKTKYGRRTTQGTRKRGVGIASGIHVSGNRQLGDWDGSSVAIKVHEDGRVTIITGESDLGQGSSTMMSQVCAHELGIPIDHITVTQADTETSPYCFGAIASRVTIIAGNAVMKASREARAMLVQVASEKLEAAAADLTIENGFIHVVGVPDRGMSVGDASRMHIFRSGGEGIMVRATYDPPTVMANKNTYFGNVAPAYSFAAQAVEVEVDTETGQVSIIDSFLADDCGKALNPLAVEGQSNGAAAQGIGWALFENLEFQDGLLVNADFADYTIPTAESIPLLRATIVESMEPNGPYGAKGASETAILPGAAAIANAVHDAIGVRINSLPITPEKILAALREQARASEVDA